MEEVSDMWDYNYLCHYGVKGMKWGVRRSQEELDRLAGRAYKIEYNSDGSYTLKKGSKLHRVSANSNPNRKGYSYVSFVNEDVKGYRKEITQWMDEENPGVKMFDLSMKATKDIRVPSEVTKVNTFLDLVQNEKIDTTPMAILNYNSTYGGKLVGKPQRLKDAMMKKGLDEDTATCYALFSMCLYKNQAYKDVFFKSLKDQGYDAIEDIEDSLSHRINPLIVFERENSLKITKVSELPEPSFYSEDWQKIVKEAKEAAESTEKYHKQMGIK